MVRNLQNIWNRIKNIYYEKLLKFNIIKFYIFKMNYNLKEILYFDFFEIFEKFVKDIEVLLELENVMLSEFINKFDFII